jgi:hypothetical protein
VNQGDLRDWLQARRALLIREPSPPGMHFVMIFCIDDPTNQVRACAEDLERAISVAQFAYDLPPKKRLELVLSTSGGIGRC